MSTPILEKYFTNPDNVMHASGWNGEIKPKELFDMWETELDYVHVLWKHIECKDWFKISVQANYWAYCNPRTTFLSTHTFLYNKMELWFPNMEDDLILEYAENKDIPTQTVYAYVPVQVIEKLLEKHWWIK